MGLSRPAEKEPVGEYTVANFLKDLLFYVSEYMGDFGIN
jgi:hypothetical protein